MTRQRLHSVFGILALLLIDCASAPHPRLAPLLDDHHAWIANQADPLTWLGATAPTCPCSQGRWDPAPAGWHRDSFWARPFHPGSTDGLRSDPQPSGASVQCRYTADGQLVTEGSAAGSADVVAPQRSIRGHERGDVQAACRAFVLAMMLGTTQPTAEYFGARPTRPGTCPILRVDPLPLKLPGACGAWPL